MVQQSEVQRTLYRTKLLLEEGQDDLALQGLESIQTENADEQREIAYLFAWYYTRRKRWDDALRFLSPLEHSEQKEKLPAPVSGTGRERLALVLLQLGNAAVNIGRYEDASRHYMQCLKLIEDKHLALPAVRLKARYSLAMTCCMNGFHAEAIEHYQKALLLCKNDEDNEDLPHIYHGLCYIYTHVGKFEKAYDAGRKALEVYRRRSDSQMEGRIYNLLGRVCLNLGSYSDAYHYYTQALTIASSHDNATMLMINFAALANLRAVEGRLEEAKKYCQQAQDIAVHVKNEHYCGVMYFVCGKVAQTEAQQYEGEQRQKLLEDALGWFEKAEKELSSTQAHVDMAELYGKWAEVLEILGRQQEALDYWKLAYRAFPHIESIE